MTKLEPASPPANPESTCPEAPRWRSDLVVHEVEGEGLVFDPRSGDTHRLNETAWFIWGRCNGHKTALDMARIVSEVYAVSAEEAVGHVERILADFGERGLFAEPDPR